MTLTEFANRLSGVFLQGETITSDIDLYGYTLQNASSLDDINARLENVLDINRRIESSKEIEALASALWTEVL